MSDANLCLLASTAETSWGVAPVPVGLKKVRLTKENLEHDKATVESAEIRDDRQTEESVEVGVNAKGGFDFELSIGDFDAFLAAALFNTFDENGLLINGTLRKSFLLEKKLATAAYQSFPGCMVDQLSLTLQSKQIITGQLQFIGLQGVSAAASLNTSGGSYATGTLTLALNAADGETVTVGGKVYTFQDTLTNVANHVKVGASKEDSLENLTAAINAGPGAGTAYAAATTANANVSAALGAGATMVVTALAIGTGGNAIASTETLAGSGNAWGGAVLSGGTNPTGGAYDDADGGLILSASANVANITVGGAALASAKSLSITVNNNLRGNDVIGKKVIDEVGLGSIKVTGKLDAYFRNRTLLETFLNHEYVAIAFSVSRAASDAAEGDLIGYTFTLPRVAFTKGQPVIPGKDQDVMLPLEFSAHRDPDDGYTIGIQKLFQPA